MNILLNTNKIVITTRIEYRLTDIRLIESYNQTPDEHALYYSPNYNKGSSVYLGLDNPLDKLVRLELCVTRVREIPSGQQHNLIQVINREGRRGGIVMNYSYSKTTVLSLGDYVNKPFSLHIKKTLLEETNNAVPEHTQLILAYKITAIGDKLTEEVVMNDDNTVHAFTVKEYNKLKG
jgi:hypothetical protein